MLRTTSVCASVNRLFHPSTPTFQAAAAAAAAAFGGEIVLPDGTADGAETEIVEEEEDEEDEEEWTGDPNNRPIWKFPVVSRVRYNYIVLVFCTRSLAICRWRILNVRHNRPHQKEQH